MCVCAVCGPARAHSVLQMEPAAGLTTYSGGNILLTITKLLLLLRCASLRARRMGQSSSVPVAQTDAQQRKRQQPRQAHNNRRGAPTAAAHRRVADGPGGGRQVDSSSKWVIPHSVRVSPISVPPLDAKYYYLRNEEGDRGGGKQLCWRPAVQTAEAFIAAARGGVADLDSKFIPSAAISVYVEVRPGKWRFKEFRNASGYTLRALLRRIEGAVWECTAYDQRELKREKAALQRGGGGGEFDEGLAGHEQGGGAAKTVQVSQAEVREAMRRRTLCRLLIRRSPNAVYIAL